jgi:hypothetical protein
MTIKSRSDMYLPAATVEALVTEAWQGSGITHRFPAWAAVSIRGRGRSNLRRICGGSRSISRTSWITRTRCFRRRRSDVTASASTADLNSG